MKQFETTFDDNRESYEESRPMYVRELYDDIFHYQPVGKENRVLEIGMGTGKATQPVLDTGCSLTGIEPGEHLAEMARERFGKYGNLSVLCQTFQEYAGSAETFDLIYAATSFHWIPEEYGYPKVYELLKKGGAFARFAYHAGPDRGRPELAAEIQEYYKKYMDRTGKPKQFRAEDAEKLSKTAGKYGFQNAIYYLYYITKDFTAEEYMELLKTYPDHMSLPETERRKLFDGIFSAINRHGGTLTVYYTMDLELARKG